MDLSSRLHAAYIKAICAATHEKVLGMWNLSAWYRNSGNSSLYGKTLPKPPFAQQSDA